MASWNSISTPSSTRVSPVFPMMSFGTTKPTLPIEVFTPRPLVMKPVGEGGSVTPYM